VTERIQLSRPDGTPMRVLVVEDEDTLAQMLTMAFEYEGWAVQTAADGPGGVRAAREFKPDVVVLDVMLPGFDGLEVLARLRAEAIEAPVLYLSARDAVPDRIAGLEAGAEDYVTKPFSLAEVVTRVRGLLRRAGSAAENQETRLVVGDLVLDESTREVSRGGVDVTLTATEFEVLRFLMQNPRHVLTKGQILEHVWRYDFTGQTNVLELYISYLRRKIEAGRPPMIHTVRGVGYVLKPAE
jgi:two-component system OmpR family response regulator